MIKIEEKKIYIDQYAIELPYRIENNKEYILFEDKIIIVFAIEECKNYNVSCYSLNGNLIWKIKEPKNEMAGEMNIGYVGISYTNSECHIIDFWGRNFIINPENGEFLSMKCAK